MIIWLILLTLGVGYLIKQGVTIVANLETLTAAVEAQGTVIDSAITLLEGLTEEIKNLEPTQEAIDALAAKVGAETQSLSDAVVANTPAA